jgi:hypothetical protein
LCFELFPKTKPPNIDPIELLTPRSSPLPLHPNLLIPRPTGDGTLQAELYIKNPVQWSTLFGNGAMGDIERKLDYFSP